MRLITVGHLAVSKCEDFANRVCASYAAGMKEASRSLSVPGKARIDQDKKVQYVGRVAEYAACLYLGIDPLRSLNWSSQCDHGYDFNYMGKSFDVKASSHPAATRLIWPVSKKHFLHKAAQVFIFARVPSLGRTELGQVVELVGCVTKQRFVSEAITANGIKGLVDGTLFMSENSLDDVATLRQNGRDIGEMA